MKANKNQTVLDICNPKKSGTLLIIGLLFWLPIFSWWGTCVKIHPVRIVKLDSNGVLNTKQNNRWDLNPMKAKFIKNHKGDWLHLNKAEIAKLPEGDYALKWESENIWSLISLELF